MTVEIRVRDDFLDVKGIDLFSECANKGCTRIARSHLC